MFLTVWMISTAVVEADQVDFAREIRPILSEFCFQCHGPDEQKREAELRLDVPDVATAARDGHTAIVPGNPEASELVARITSPDPDSLMPPPETEKQLTPEQIQTLKEWIAQGAKWDRHWAFKPPVRPALPEVSQEDWVQSPVDAFILHALETQHLTPSPRADNRTLLRRLHLDITGLPPTLEEIDAFEAHNSQDAYSDYVDHLLQSPHFGERWARHWMDAARYADSDGFEKDKPRDVWHFRDWIIQSMNQDLPYNQFIIEQIAGDLLPHATQSQKVATGFLRNSMINEEGGIDPEQFRMDAMFDRMDAIGKSILGLTIQCAQCHTHKYDPLTQLEYYRMFAFINDSAEGSMVAYSPSQLQKRAGILQAVKDIESEIQHMFPDWQSRLTRWENSIQSNPSIWMVTKLHHRGDNDQRYEELPDGSLVAGGYAPTYFTATFTNVVDMPTIRGVRLEVLTDPNLPAHGPGRSVQGLFSLSEFKVLSKSLVDPEKEKWISFSQATADFSNPDTQLEKPYTNYEGQSSGMTGSVAYAIDGKNETGWGIDAGPGRRNQSRKAVFAASENMAWEGGTILEFHLVQAQGGWNSDDNQNMNLGRFRISLTDQESPTADPVPDNIHRILTLPPEQRSTLQNQTLFSFFRNLEPEWKPFNDRIEKLWQSHPEGSTQLVLTSQEKIRETRRLERGNFLNPQEVVTPGVPEFLHPLPPKDQYSRLDFARWLASEDSPTTARSMVNRIWQAYFGIGLVATPEDLGSQAAVPSHPELLDWLAVELMENGWQLKSIHRLILNSSTYQQSSIVQPHHLELDPQNRYLARSPRVRVEGEIIRDISLAASGLLDRSIGGPSVYPPAPEFLFKPPASYGPKTWNTQLDSNRYRRGIYTFRFRSVPYPMLEAFDVPNGDFSCVRRSRSNTPQQALTALNEPVFMESALALASMTLNLGGRSDTDRLDFAFRRCLTRNPDPLESQTLIRFLNTQRERFLENRDQAAELIQAHSLTNESGPIDPVPLASWTALCRILLNLDETIMRQ